MAMTVWKTIVNLFVGIVFVPMMAAQTLKIVPTDVSILQTEWRRALYMPVRCDADQNLYLRAYEMGNSNSPLMKVNSKGDKVTKLTIDSDPDLRRGTVQDFALSPDGTAYELVQVGDDVYIASFSTDGSYGSKTKLERQFWGTHLAASTGSASFLVAGSELPVKDGPPPKLVTALFATGGRLIRELRLPSDPAEIKERDAGKKKVENYLSDKSILPLILGDVETDRDGNMYVLRASTPPVVFVIDGAGELVRTFKIEPPGPDMKLGVMHIRAGRLAVLFQATDTQGQMETRKIVLIDAASGTKISEYVVTDELGAAFACYTGDTFGFVTTKAGKLAIQHARPE